MVQPMTLDDLIEAASHISTPASHHLVIIKTLLGTPGVTAQDLAPHVKEFSEEMAKAAEGAKARSIEAIIDGDKPKSDQEQPVLDAVANLGGQQVAEHLTAYGRAHTKGGILNSESSAHAALANDFQAIITAAIKTSYPQIDLSGLSANIAKLPAAPTSAMSAKSAPAPIDYATKLEQIKKLSPAAANTFQTFAELTKELDTNPNNVSIQAAIVEAQVLFGGQIVAATATRYDSDADYRKDFEAFMGPQAAAAINSAKPGADKAYAVATSARSIAMQAVKSAPDNTALIVPKNALSDELWQEVDKIAKSNPNAAATMIAIQRLMTEPSDQSPNRKGIEEHRSKAIDLELKLLEEQLNNKKLFKEAKEALEKAGVSGPQVQLTDPSPQHGGTGAQSQSRTVV